jgi:molecular chaperone GrpE (heat shock protein)
VSERTRGEQRGGGESDHELSHPDSVGSRATETSILGSKDGSGLGREYGLPGFPARFESHGTKPVDGLKSSVAPPATDVSSAIDSEATDTDSTLDPLTGSPATGAVPHVTTDGGGDVHETEVGPSDHGACSRAVADEDALRQVARVLDTVSEAVSRLAADTATAAAREREQANVVAVRLAEIHRLRVRDTELVDRLHAENTRLRTGEFVAAVAPLIGGLLRLHDQMTSLSGGDPNSVAGMLRTQLLQVLDTGAGLTPFVPAVGDLFDTTRHVGAGRASTDDPARVGTVCRTLKPGFIRLDGSIVRVAEVEVYRLAGTSAKVSTD